MLGHAQLKNSEQAAVFLFISCYNTADKLKQVCAVLEINLHMWT
jgi:hypothetical protein